MITRMKTLGNFAYSEKISMKSLCKIFSFYSCGEGEDYHPFLDRSRNRHNRRLFRRLNNINHNHLDSQQIIPRQNARLRSLFDRVNQEIEKYRSK
jgi:hypothetical protein